MKQIEIAKHKIGPNLPCFIIAEAGVNHNGSYDMACELIDAAEKTGVDAIKFQTFKTEKLVTIDAPKADYQQETTGKKESQYEMLRQLELSDKAYFDLKEYCNKNNIMFLSSPFDEQSADFLENLDVSAFKIPSGEITNLPFLSYVASKGKPMIVSTGMSNLGEVEMAVDTIEATGNKSLILLHCVSNYPAKFADVNLRAMRNLESIFNVPVGFSDHTKGIEVAIGAVALGACTIEKHFTLNRNLPGPDHQASIEPHELLAMVKSIRNLESAMGNGRKIPAVSEANVAAVARKSLVAACDIPTGTLLTENMLTVRRPGIGFVPSMRGYLIGRKTKISIKAGTVFTWEMLA